MIILIILIILIIIMLIIIIITIIINSRIVNDFVYIYFLSYTKYYQIIMNEYEILPENVLYFCDFSLKI